VGCVVCVECFCGFCWFFWFVLLLVWFFVFGLFCRVVGGCCCVSGCGFVVDWFFFVGLWVCGFSVFWGGCGGEVRLGGFVGCVCWVGVCIGVWVGCFWVCGVCGLVVVLFVVVFGGGWCVCCVCLGFGVGCFGCFLLLGLFVVFPPPWLCRSHRDADVNQPKALPIGCQYPSGDLRCNRKYSRRFFGCQNGAEPSPLVASHIRHDRRRARHPELLRPVLSFFSFSFA